jgi:1-acyl-sn-glycerol-3-phosphate acyltransferase
MTPERNQIRLRHLLGIPAFIYIVLNLSVFIGPVILLALIKLIVPLRPVRRMIYIVMAKIYAMAVAVNVFLFRHIIRVDLDVTGLEDLRPDRDQLVIVNHQSWTDIVLVQNLLHRRTPIPKFIAKREVLFLPFIGLICWAYEYPLVRRYGRVYVEKHPEKAGTDLRILEKHFARPDLSLSSIINFVEGTRRTPAKAARQRSPYRYLIKPKAGGLTNLIQALGTRIPDILDITIVYEARPPIFWDLLSGRARKIVMRARRISLTDWFPQYGNEGFRPGFDDIADRLNALWRDKDDEIARIREDLGLPTIIPGLNTNMIPAPESESLRNAPPDQPG